MTAPTPHWQDELTRSTRMGAIGMALGVLAISAWAALAPLSAAVMADGSVKTLGNRKTVQHAEGGIVSVIHVKDGDQVLAGQVLITLADQRVSASATGLHQQWLAEKLRVQRLQAESTFSAYTPSPALVKDLQAAKHSEPLAREQAIYIARADQLAQQTRWLTEQQAQVTQEIANNQQLIQTTQSAYLLAQRELTNHQKLALEGFVSEGRLIELQRALADYKGRVETQQTQLTQARQKAAELNLKIASLKADFAKVAADELKDATQKAAQLQQELRPAQDAQTRQQILAPVAGEVVDLKVFTQGAAIGAREPLLDIAPSGGGLVIETRISPSDIREVRVGTPVQVLLTAYRQRATPQVAGSIAYIGADR